MFLLDSFSYFTEGHPATRPGDFSYLAAPAWAIQPEATADPAAFRKQAEAWPRLIGGLLPVLGLPERAMAEALDDPWWCGLVLAPSASGLGLTDPTLFQRLEWPEAEQLPLVIDCGIEGFSRPPQLQAFLERVPARPVVLTHGGQLNISGGHLNAAADLFRLFPQTYLETSGIYRQDWLESMLTVLGPRRILYGSGFPRMDEEMEQARVTSLPTESLADLLGANAARLFGL